MSFLAVIYVGLSVLTSTALAIIFRELKRYNVHLFQAITINYLACVLTGIALLPSYFSVVAAADPAWVPFALGQGALFIGLFFLMGTAYVQLGVTVTMILTKLSLVLPTLVAWLYFSEDMPRLRWLGVAFAMAAVVLVNWPQKRNLQAQVVGATPGPRWLQIFLAFGLFLGSGISDINFKIFDAGFGTVLPPDVFAISLFGAAGALGLLVTGVQLARGAFRWEWKNLWGGIILGVPNYFSIYFLMKALREMGDGTRFFPINNTALVLAAALVGVLLYRERFTPIKLVGLGLAVAAVLLLAQ